MAITSVKTGSSFTNLQKYDNFLGPNAAYNPSSFESIATVTATSGTSVTLSSIPSTYQHLQIRWQAARNGSSNGQLNMRINGDTGANYAYHAVYGDGATVTALGGASDTRIQYLGFVRGSSFDYKARGVIDLHDYASTTKNKTVRNFAGVDTNGAGTMWLTSGLWMNTAAVTSITFDLLGDTFNTTEFSLYGIKGA